MQPDRRRRSWGLVVAGLLVCFAVAGVVRVRARQPELAVVRMLGGPAPASLRNVRFHSDELLGLNPEPSYWLRFEASADDVAAMLKREGFLLDPSPSGSNARPQQRPDWPPLKNAGRGVVYRRERKPAGCVVESLWWDSVAGEVFYWRSCP